jgi:hypothetical protein
VCRVDGDRIDVRRQPLVVRDGCAPDRTPAGRWPSDGVLVRSEQFAVNEALASLAPGGAGEPMLGLHAPPGTGVAEVFGDLVAAIVTERARLLADLPDPAAAFGDVVRCGPYTVTAPAPELAGFEIVLSAAGPAAAERAGGAPGLTLPPLGARWRDRAARADYFASTARLSDGVGAWAMLVARLGDYPANRDFAARWWNGAVRGTDVLFPSGESMAATLRQLKDETVDWAAAVAWFSSALRKVQHLADERARVAAALARLSLLEQACEEASCSVEAAQIRVAELTDREPAARHAVIAAEEEYRAALAALGAHELLRPALTTVTPQGAAALRSRGALPVALAGTVRRAQNWRNWSAVRRRLRAACAMAERRMDAVLREAETLRGGVTAARLTAAAGIADIARLTAEIKPLTETAAAARQRWGDHVPAGPSQAETKDPVLIEWRETTAPWADEEYANARVQVFIAALELHKALIAARPEIFENNLAVLMKLISAGAESARGSGQVSPASDRGDRGQGHRGRGDKDRREGDRGGSGREDGTLADVLLAAWQSFFLVIPVVQVPFEAARPLFGGLEPGSLGWLLAAGADQLAAEDAAGLPHGFGRAVFAGTGPQRLADRAFRYGTWLPAGSPGIPDDAGPRWVGLPLRVVRGQDRTTVEQRNDVEHDGLLISERD